MFLTVLQLITRTWQYRLLGTTLLIAAILTANNPWHSNAYTHTFVEGMATLLALVITVISMARYYSQKNISYLLLGMAFLGTFLLDGYHTMVTSVYFKSLMPSTLPTLIPWSWLASRQFLALYLFLGWLLWLYRYTPSQGIKRFEQSLFALTAIAIIVFFMVFALVPLPPAYSAWLGIHRPSELIPLVFFAVTLVGYLIKGKWRTDAFEHWLVMSLIINVLVQLCYMPNSTQLFDLKFDAAHWLKLLSYICVFNALMISTYQAFDREKTSNQAMVDAAKQAEQAIIQSIQHGITVYDTKLRLVSCNPLFIYMMDIDRQIATAGRPINDLFRWGTPALLDEIINKQPIHHRFNVSGDKVIDVIGEAVEVGYVITYTDVTEIVAAETEAKRASKVLMEMLATSPVGIGISGVDDDRILWINSRGAKQLGFDNPTEAIGFSAKNCWADEKQREAFIARFNSDGQVNNTEVELRCQRGEPFWCYLSWYKINYEGQSCKLYWMYDITEYRAAQQQLADAQKMASLGRLVAGVAHEINTPLGVAITAVSYLAPLLVDIAVDLANGKLGKQQLENTIEKLNGGFKIINTNLDSAAALVESFKQISVDRINEQPRAVKLNQYCQHIVQTLSPVTKNAKVELTFICTKEIVFNTYPGLISQVITNLTTNSIKHAFVNQHDRKIIIALSGGEGKPVTIEYTDNGIGISEDIIANVMEPFFTTARNRGGTGLGLSIVHTCIVEKLNGTIKLTGNEGHGANFIITIPPIIPPTIPPITPPTNLKPVKSLN